MTNWAWNSVTTSLGLGDYIALWNQRGKLLEGEVGLKSRKAVLDIRDFGNVDTKANRDCSTAMNLMITEARKTGATAVLPAGGKYLFQQPINATFPAGSNAVNLRPITVRCEGGTGLGPPSDTSSGCIIADHSGPVFDCTGGYDWVWDGINIQATAANPSCGWLLARNSANSSAGKHTFLRPKAYGPFVNGVVYSYASEENTYFAPHFVNTYGGSAIILITGSNIRSLSSTLATMATGIKSNTVTNVFGGTLHANNAAGDVFYLEGTEELGVIGTFMHAASSAGNGHALVNVDTTNATTDFCWFDKIRGEHATFFAEYGVRFGDTARTCTGWTLSNWRLATNTMAISGHANVSLNTLRVSQFSEMGTPHGMSVANTTDCILETGNMTLNISGTSTRDVITGASTSWTIAARVNGLHLNADLGTVT